MDVCARGEGLAWLQLAWASESGLRDGLGGEHGAGEDRIVDRTDGWGEEQGTSVSNIEHIGGAVTGGGGGGGDETAWITCMAMDSINSIEEIENRYK